MPWDFDTTPIQITPKKTKANNNHINSQNYVRPILYDGTGQLYLKKKRRKYILVDRYSEVAYKPPIGQGEIYITNINHIRNNEYILELDGGRFFVKYKGNISKEIEYAISENEKQDKKNNTRNMLFSPKEAYRFSFYNLFASLAIGLTAYGLSLTDEFSTFSSYLAAAATLPLIVGYLVGETTPPLYMYNSNSRLEKLLEEG